MIERQFLNLIVQDLKVSKSFYCELLDMTVHFESDWFVILKPDGSNHLELGLLVEGHDIIPSNLSRKPGGSYPCFVVKDVNKVFEKALALGVDLIQPPTDLFYGQRRMVLNDPDGTTLDISSPTPASD